MAGAPTASHARPRRAPSTAGSRSVDWRDYTHVVKLDGDIELPPDTSSAARALRRRPAARHRRRDLVEPRRRPAARIADPARTTSTARSSATRRECFEAIGGVQERLGWDTIDETYARMRGFTTRTFPDLVAIHHRPLGSADGTLRGRARHGECATSPTSASSGSRCAR